MQSAHTLNLADAFLNISNAVTDATAVNLQLSFAGTAGTDAAAKTRQRQALAHNTRQRILQLRQLNLQLTFISMRTLGENIKDKRRAVKHTHTH